MHVRIVEVGPRDGLQNIESPIPKDVKKDLIQRLRQCGLQNIEITSIVSPKAVPQLTDCREILSSEPVKAWLREESSLHLPVLIPNIKGLQIAIELGVKEIAVFISASEGFSRANIKCSVQQAIEQAKEVSREAIRHGMAVRGYVSCIFADPFDGPTAPSAVHRVTQELLDAGCYEISLGDTLGVGTATDVRRLVQYLGRQGISLDRLAGHFHDTYGQAVANVWEAYQCGIRNFDSSVAGLGGCPFAPGAEGNVPTEDIVYLFEAAGIETGVNLRKVVDVGVWISQQLRRPYKSRAGTALAAKSRLARAKHASAATINDAAAKATKLAWSLVSETESLSVYRCGANGKVVLNRPRNGNALTSMLIVHLTEAFRGLEQDSSISRIVLTATGKFFCTGMDLGASGTTVGSRGGAADATFNGLTELLELVDNSSKVTIACINGPAFGGGVGLAFACDIRLSVSSATFTLSEVKLGLCPAVISKYVAREWGIARTREAMLTARPVTTLELLSSGALSAVAESSDDLEATLEGRLRALRYSSATGSRMSKELVKLSWIHGGKPEQRDGISTLFQSMMQPGTQGAHGVREFQSKRMVDWDSYVSSGSKAKAKI